MGGEIIWLLTVLTGIGSWFWNLKNPTGIEIITSVTTMIALIIAISFLHLKRETLIDELEKTKEGE